MADTLKIVIPAAGWGTRMRPHTFSKPKPLISVAGKTTLEHLLEMFASVPNPQDVEFVFIVSPHLGEQQIPAFIKEKYPDMKAHFVVQHEMKGQSHAIALAREHLQGPMLICFSDTLMETDFSLISDPKADAIAWVMPVPDPRRFGVAELGEDGMVARFIEKPQTTENNLVVVGCYYFKSAESLLAAIDEQVRRNIALKNEFFLTDAISVMIEQGAKVRTQTIDTWLDTGTVEATLDTNRILLERGRANKTKNEKLDGVEIIAPCFVHPSAEIQASVIGPYASIGPNCKIHAAVISDSIIEEGAEIEHAALKRSLIGRNCRVEGQSIPEEASSLNIGDHSMVIHP